jgi:predicted permease
MQAFFQDIRFSFRLMRKRPGMSFLVITALVLGIGLNTAVFSVVNAVILRPLPLFEPERIVKLYANVKGSSLGISYPEYLDWQTQSSSFEAITVYRNLSLNLTGTAFPEHVKAFAVSPSCSKVFGVSTAIGRHFTDQDDQAGAARVVILNYRFWQRRFGGDPGVVGKVLFLDDHAYTIVGVLQDRPVSILQLADVWVPNTFFLDQSMMNRKSRYYWPVARLRHSVTGADATRELETIAGRLAAQYPASNKDVGIKLVNLKDLFTADSRTPVLFLLLASSFIFVLACVNVLLVFLTNTIERRRELSVRLALGTPRATLLRQFFVQALVLVGISAALALAVAKLGLTLLIRRFPNAVGRFQETSLDYKSILFLIAMAFIVGALGAILPALYTSRMNISSTLKDDTNSSVFSRYRAFGQNTLIVFEICLACALSLLSGLLIKSFYEVSRVDMGFNPHQILTFQINLPPSRYKQPEQLSSVHKYMLDNLSAIPGITAASGLSSLPLTTQGDLIDLQVDSDPTPATKSDMVEYECVLPGLFRTINLPLLQGRDFTNSERGDTPRVVIVDEILATKFWPGQSPLGKRIRLPEPSDPKAPWREIVGVVRQIRHFGPESRPRWMQVYLPQYQEPTNVLSFVMDTTLPMATVKTAAENAIHQIDKDLPLDNFQSMDELLDSYMVRRKVSLLLFSAFASIGITLGAIGIYAIVANSVTRRRRELAIRLALGATRRHTVLLITRAAAISTLAGILCASFIVVGVRRILATFLFGVTPLDPAVFVLCVVTTIVLAALAALLPTAPLFRLDPQKVLRE